MLEEIRKRLKAAPFEPFSVRTADGRVFEIPSPEFLWMPAPGVLHIWRPADGASERINPLLIVGVEGPEQWAA